MKRRSIYIETSIVSYLAARRSHNLVAAAWQHVTWEFWELRLDRYDLFTSEIVVAGAEPGEIHAADRRLALLRGITELPVDDEVKALVLQCSPMALCRNRRTRCAAHSRRCSEPS